MAQRAARPYHHGNLAAALLDAAVEMAAAGGPESVVLREVARRVGVSATAAYRHFAGQADLAEAVKDAALDRLAEHLRSAMGRGDLDGRVPLPGVAPGSPQERAIRRLEAVGRAYFEFAITQPGLFRCFCIGLPVPDSVQLPDHGTDADADRAAAEPPTRRDAADADRTPAEPPTRRDAAFGVLAETLDDLVTVGVLSPERRTSGVDIALWSAVHGLSVLCLDGPLADMPREQQDAMLTAVTDVIFHGLAGPTVTG